MPASHPVTKEGDCGAFLQNSVSQMHSASFLILNQSAHRSHPPLGHGKDSRSRLTCSEGGLHLLHLEAAGPLLSLNTTPSTVGLSPVIGTERNTWSWENLGFLIFLPKLRDKTSKSKRKIRVFHTHPFYIWSPGNLHVIFNHLEHERNLSNVEFPTEVS